MGLFKKILKKNLTLEEQEKKSQEEREWAEKCMKAGENFAKKIKFDEKVNSINSFANKYPRTFFMILTGIILGCFLINHILSTSINFFDNEIENVEVFEKREMPKLEEDEVMKMMRTTTDSLINRAKVLEQELNNYLDKDSYSREDSIKIRDILLEIRDIQLIVSGESEIN